MRYALLPLALWGCPKEDPTTPTTPTTAPTTDTPTTEPTDPGPLPNTWWVDDQELTGLYPSLNCQRSDDLLILNGADSGGVGTIQLVFGTLPTEDRSYTVVPGASPLPDDVYVSIGLDREPDNQFVAQSGTVEVEVSTGPPQRYIQVRFEDLPSLSDAGDAPLLSADAGAHEGMYVGACDFDDLLAE